MTTHLIESDFQKSFPSGLDEFPTPADDDNFIDAWLLNTAFSSLTAIETYLLLYKSTIESPLGDDLVGDDGSLVIDIPAARYPAGLTATASDSALLPGHILSGISIFGVAGSLVISSGSSIVAIPSSDILAPGPAFIDSDNFDFSASTPLQTSHTATSP